MASVDIVLALISHQGRFFLQRRAAAAKVFPGLWEFPGGKVEAGESPEAALRRELREELDWEPARLLAEAAWEHAYPDGTRRFHPFRCEGPLRVRTELAWGWFSLAEMRKLPMPEANAALLERLGTAN